MSVMRHLSRLALRPLAEGACHAVGAQAAGTAIGAVADVLVERFTDHSQRLHVKLELAVGRTWTALEVALAGESFWERCSACLARGEERGFRQQLKTFLEALPQDRLPLPREEFRARCLAELRAARKAGLLAGVPQSAQQLAEDASVFARFDDPTKQLQTEMKVIAQMAESFRGSGHAHLAILAAAGEGTPLLVMLVRFFFRRALEEDQELFRSLAWSQTEQLGEQQARGFASLEQLVVTQAGQLRDLLAEVQEVVEQTHSAVLDVQQELRDQGRQNKAIYDAVLELQRRLDLPAAEVRPRDSLSIRNDAERQIIKDVVRRYRALPEEQRREMPALLNAIGKLEVASGDFQAAEKDFAAVAGLVEEPAAKAEARHNAYRAALERRDWTQALDELKEAARLDPRRFSPFPMDKYQPQRILGAGGFGVAFLCKHKFSAGLVVVKTLTASELDQDVNRIFAEAQALQALNHPGIVGLKDCGFGDESGSSRPYMVMDFFDGPTLDEHVRQHGPLDRPQVLPLAIRVAEALYAAHQKGILHRDVKPANLLVRKEGEGWQVKLIDFGLALRPATMRDTSKQGMTLVGTSIAGTLDYAAPEQMGRLPGVPAGPYSDVYGFGKTLCYALFQTTQPVLKHWQSIPEPLAELLGRCLSDKPDERPAEFAAVLRCLKRLPALEMAALPMVVLEPEPVAPRPARSSRRSVAATEFSVPRERRRQEDDVQPAPPQRKSSRGGIWLPLLGVGLVGGLLLFGFWFVVSSLKGGRNPGPPGVGGMPNFPNPWPPDSKPIKTAPVFSVKDPEAGRVYLAGLTPTEKSKQAPVWGFGKPGDLGAWGEIKVNGYNPKQGVSLGPPAARTEPMFIKYDIPANVQPCLLTMMVALDDSSGDSEKPGVFFEVLGPDDKALWKSKTIKKIGETDECRINLTGIDRITIRYTSLDREDNQTWTRPVWLDPYLIAIDKSSPEGLTPSPVSKPQTVGKKKYLSDLQEVAFHVGGATDGWKLGKNGLLGDKAGTKIKFESNEWPHALGTHAAARNEYAWVRYKLDGKATALQTTVAINDAAFHARPLIFQVVGDGKVLWNSGAVGKQKSAQCLVDLTGVQELELRVRITILMNMDAHGVWLDPAVYFVE